MEFKKTIAMAAVTASSVFALTAPPTESKTICLNTRQDANGVLFGANCDSAQNNVKLGLEILANGCAANQVSVRATKFGGGNFNVQVHSCLPPNVVQL